MTFEAGQRGNQLNLLDEYRSVFQNLLFTPAAGDHGLWPWRNVQSSDRDVAPHGREAGDHGLCPWGSINGIYFSSLSSDKKGPCPNQGKDRIVSWLLFKMKRITEALQDDRL